MYRFFSAFRSAASALLVIGLLTLVSCRSHSQVTASVETIDGKEYYMHLVEKGQTVYAISKLYKCDINDVLAANPGSDSGIQEGQTLKIPVAKSGVERPQVKTEGSKSYINHEVQKKETLFGIARKYNVDANAIVELNPGADQGLKKGQVLKIPVANTPPIKPSTPSEPASVVNHTVQPGETLYGIARQYNIPVDVILQANPGMTENLSPGQQIRIPQRALPLEPVAVPSNEGFRPVAVEGPVFEQNYTIGLMMPFMMDTKDTVGLSEKELRLRDASFNFYRGALLALDSVKAEGLSADLYVYDLADDRNEARELLRKKEMTSMDLIIGPAFRDPLAEVSAWGKDNGVHVVCPIPQVNKVLLQSPNMSKAISSELTQWEAIGYYIGKTYGKENVIVVNTTDVDDLKLLNVFHAGFYRAAGDSAVEFKTASRATSGITAMLKVSGKNIIVVPSNDRLLITTLFKNVKGTNNIVVGMESWENMDLIEVADRNRCHLMYPKTIFVDYTDPHDQLWIEAYRKRYRTEPSEYAALGYDLIRFYGRALIMFGRDFPNHFGAVPQHSLISTGFEFFRTGNESGFENRHLFLISTEEFRLIPIDVAE